MPDLARVLQNRSNYGSIYTVINHLSMCLYMHALDLFACKEALPYQAYSTAIPRILIYFNYAKIYSLLNKMAHNIFDSYLIL